MLLSVVIRTTGPRPLSEFNNNSNKSILYNGNVHLRKNVQKKFQLRPHQNQLQDPFSQYGLLRFLAYCESYLCPHCYPNIELGTKFIQTRLPCAKFSTEDPAQWDRCALLWAKLVFFPSSKSWFILVNNNGGNLWYIHLARGSSLGDYWNSES